MQLERYDYVVLGSGPGGYVSAIRAAQLGLKTLVIEKAEVGGICLNWGCIPTKALLHYAHLYRSLKEQDMFINREAFSFDLAKMIAFSRKVAERLSRGIESLFRKYKVDLVKGSGFIEAPGKIFVENGNEKKEIIAEKICIATGGRAREIAHLKFSTNVISYKEALVLETLPKKILIVGAGAIGCEFADFYNSLGSEVTLVEIADHILPLEEKSVAEVLAKSFRQRGIQLFENSTVKQLEDNGKVVFAEIEKQNQIFRENYDKVLLALGISPNIEGIGFENTGGILEKGTIKTDALCRVVGSRNIFAIGDVAGGKQLAHKASHEGIIAAETAAGKKVEPLDSRFIPACIYTKPQVASIGYKEEELKNLGIPYELGSFPFIASGKALAMNEEEGFFRIYLHRETGEILGAHFVGPEVSELISQISLAITGELTYAEFSHAVAPHPTLAEGVFEAILQAKGKSCNI